MKKKGISYYNPKYIFIIFLALFSLNIHARITDSLNYKVETGVSFSSGQHTPLWLSANKQGVGSIIKNNGYLDAGVFSRKQQIKNLSYDYGLEIAGAYNYPASFFIHQAYLDLNYKIFGLSIGSKNQYDFMMNQELSSGGLTFSGNSLPIPQVLVGIPNYYTVPKTKGWFAFKGWISYGMFTDGNWQEHFAGRQHQNFVKNTIYHDKAIFFKIGPTNQPLNFEFGLDMPARFSGTFTDKNGTTIKYPHRFHDFWNIFIPNAGDNQTSVADQGNIEGDMLGSWNFRLTYKLKDWTFKVYYEHQFTDQSQLFVQYGWMDGMWGGEIDFPKNRFISSLVYEHIYSKDQTSPVYHDSDNLIPDQISGADDYYNHSTYSGWQHWGMAIGNPLFVSPVYNKDGNLNFESNRIIANHLGISGDPTNELHYRLLFSHTLHWGTYQAPFPDIKYNINSMVEVAYTPLQLQKHWIFKLALANDASNYIGNSFGGLLTISFIK